jgi:hypothetical protein
VRTLLIAGCLVAAAGCGASVAGPDVPLDRPFTLGVGEAAAVSGTRLTIEFTGVTGDSRCPADAICIQGGDAIVQIRVSGVGTATYELHTGDSARASVVHGSYRISLVDVQPYPFSTGPISSNDYRATFTVTRR